jgi:hypothetical protein
MTKAYIQTLLQRPIAFHRVFVPLGGVTGALFLSQLLYWSDRGSEGNGWIYKTQAEWTDETGMTRREQETARRQLREAGVIEESYKGLPAKLFYRINFDALSEFIEGQVKVAETRTSKDGGNVHAGCTKAPSKRGGKRQSTNRTETTSETTAEAVRALSECGKQAAAASSVDERLEVARKRGAVIESEEDQLVLAELIAEFELPKVLETIDAVRHEEHRRAYASTLRKKLKSSVALQKNKQAVENSMKFEIDTEDKIKAKAEGSDWLANLARKKAAKQQIAVEGV